MKQRVMIVLLAAAIAASAQYYPRPRRLPGGIPTTDAVKDLAGSFHGTLKQLTNKEVVIQNDEGQTVVIRRSRKTKFLMAGKDIKSSAIALNTLVTVEAAEDIDLKPTAVSVEIDVPKLDDKSEAKQQQ